MDTKSPFLKRPDYVVCTCMEVMYSQLVEAIKEGEDSFNKLSDRLGVGTGCSSCVEEVKAILKEELL
jgi:assimilatory nitrate reductase catalytic subunit